MKPNNLNPMGVYLITSVDENVSEQIEQKIEREQVAKVTGTNKDDSVAKAPVRRETKKIQRRLMFINSGML